MAPFASSPPRAAGPSPNALLELWEQWSSSGNGEVTNNSASGGEVLAPPLYGLDSGHPRHQQQQQLYSDMVSTRDSIVKLEAAAQQANSRASETASLAGLPYPYNAGNLQPSPPLQQQQQHQQQQMTVKLEALRREAAGLEQNEMQAASLQQQTLSDLRTQREQLARQVRDAELAAASARAHAVASSNAHAQLQQQQQQEHWQNLANQQARQQQQQQLQLQQQQQRQLQLQRQQQEQMYGYNQPGGGRALPDADFDDMEAQFGNAQQAAGALKPSPRREARPAPRQQQQQQQGGSYAPGSPEDVSGARGVATKSKAREQHQPARGAGPEAGLKVQPTHRADKDSRGTLRMKLPSSHSSGAPAVSSPPGSSAIKKEGHKLLTRADLKLNLVGAQLLLYWPDSGEWWTGQVLSQDVTKSSALILYSTNEEEEVNLRELVDKRELAWPPGAKKPTAAAGQGPGGAAEGGGAAAERGHHQAAQGGGAGRKEPVPLKGMSISVPTGVASGASGPSLASSSSLDRKRSQGLASGARGGTAPTDLKRARSLPSPAAPAQQQQPAAGQQRQQQQQQQQQQRRQKPQTYDGSAAYMQQQYGTPGDGSLAQASNMGGYDSGTGSMDMGAMSGFGDMAGGASMLLDDPLALAGLDDDFLALQQLPASSSSTMVGQLLQHGSIILGRQIKVYQQMEGRW
eukprot:CAMPEP_0202895282 /NCGR_PEP_ID=MMETSP1392-20130828/4525_1 /ASSEMBLY_ACC=CAM_ASM_000868 /TAXON_ID=225041 /ORGANISM="Chlamydomonas chlamydogama, Strain SAG 11-48b" /LENGTH=686 /DNA_ID=CAMNT_0049580239 /DNA_START=67 /DNA_END=2124 /DNA_ORIENTATION=-